MLRERKEEGTMPVKPNCDCSRPCVICFCQLNFPDDFEMDMMGNWIPKSERKTNAPCGK